MSRQFTKEFKEDAVRYYLEHKDLGITVCAKNLGTSRTAFWENNRGSIY
jgi:transposase